MRPYFASEEAWWPFFNVLRKWIGTPYRHLWMTRGRGADCSLFVGAVLMEIGVVKQVVHDFYPPDWYLNTKKEIVLETFARNIFGQLHEGFTIQQIPLDSPLMRGDIPGFCTVPQTGVTNHTGILLDPPTVFLHSIQGRGVSHMNWGRWWKDRMTVLYRVMVL